MYRVTKHYPHSLGLSTCFRQWRAESHCRFLHGYALAFTIEVEAADLDARNWVVDYGAFKTIKNRLFETFDHKLIVAADDPLHKDITELDEFARVAQVITLPRVGCEAFASLVGLWVETMLVVNDMSPRVRLSSVTCHEHEGNSATYISTF